VAERSGGAQLQTASNADGLSEGGGMSFRPESLRGAGSAPSPGQIDYRLIRKHTVDEFKRGRLSRLDVCDAQPELLRAARNCGRPSQQPCPICESDELVLVSFVFGPRLPAHGRCVTSAKELDRLGRRIGVLACYVVEVCSSCSWNHLLRTFPLGGRQPQSARS
jgi:hypothetical protein